MTTEHPYPFAPDVVAAVVAHMNGDHPDDNLLIARSLGGLPEATGARMTGVGPEGARFEATLPDGQHREAVVAWGSEVAERADIRREVVRMYHEACVSLGVEPRAAAEH